MQLTINNRLRTTSHGMNELPSGMGEVQVDNCLRTTLNDTCDANSLVRFDRWGPEAIYIYIQILSIYKIVLNPP